MTSTSATTNSVFQAFIEAQHALEQLPAVEQELASAKSELDTTHHALDDAELRAMQLEDDVKALRATLAAKEEALAAATFREGEATAKLKVIFSVVGSHGDTSSSEPSNVVVDSSVNVNRGEAASTNDSDSQEGSHMGEGASTAGMYADTASEKREGTVSTYDAGHTHTEDYSHMGEVGSVASTGAPYGGASSSNAGSHGDVSTAAEGQSEAGPTAMQVDGSQSGSVSSLNAGQKANALSNRAEPIPYWQKPATTSWREWVAAGNQPAPWLGKDFFDPHTVAAK